MIRLVDVDAGNWRTPLRVKPEQEKFVANATVLLARAYAFRKENSRAFLIYDDDMPVGMGLYYDCPELGCYDFSQLFIDAGYQGRGYGKAATKMVLDVLRQDGRFEKVMLCYVEGNDTARRMYEQFGFRETYRDEDEIEMELHF